MFDLLDAVEDFKAKQSKRKQDKESKNELAPIGTVFKPDMSGFEYSEQMKIYDLMILERELEIKLEKCRLELAEFYRKREAKIKTNNSKLLVSNTNKELVKKQGNY